MKSFSDFFCFAVLKKKCTFAEKNLWVQPFIFSSATEILPDFLTAILNIYREKPVFITC
jgi:hypothetical protein